MNIPREYVWSRASSEPGEACCYVPCLLCPMSLSSMSLFSLSLSSMSLSCKSLSYMSLSCMSLSYMSVCWVKSPLCVWCVPSCVVLMSMPRVDDTSCVTHDDTWRHVSSWWVAVLMSMPRSTLHPYPSSKRPCLSVCACMFVWVWVCVCACVGVCVCEREKVLLHAVSMHALLSPQTLWWVSFHVYKYTGLFSFVYRSLLVFISCSFLFVQSSPWFSWLSCIVSAGIHAFIVDGRLVA